MDGQYCYDGSMREGVDVAVRIETMGVLVPGHVVRKREGDDTVLSLTGEQARSLHDSLGTVVDLFASVEE